MNINRVVLTGNLTADPEMRPTPGGTPAARLRLAVDTRRRNSSTGTWEDKANYFDLTVWGAPADNCERYLSKGRPVAIDGRLERREYEARDGTKRQAVEIIAETVQSSDRRPTRRRILARTRVNLEVRVRHRYSRRARSARTGSHSQSRAQCGSAVSRPAAQRPDDLPEGRGRASATMASEANGGFA